MVFTRLLRSWTGRHDAREARAARQAKIALREERQSRGEGDLYKALAALTSPVGARPVAGADALIELTSECIAILQAMRGAYSDMKVDPLRGLAIETGWLSGSADATTPRGRPKETRVPFLFFRVPGRPGFLIEPEEGSDSGAEGPLFLYRAVEARPLMRNDSTGESERPSLFSRRSDALTHLVRLEPGLWRQVEGTTSPSTLSVTRVAERLLARAVHEMVSD